jgi:hypothetical protein
MDSKGTHGPRAKMRDHSFAVIVADVWSVLLTRTLSRLSRIIQQRDEFDPLTPGQNPIDDLEWWEGKLLGMWIPRHYKLGVEESWMQRFFDDLASGSLQQHQLSATVQRHAHLGDEFEKLVHISMEDEPSQ